jgi:hypothetical protein
LAPPLINQAEPEAHTKLPNSILILTNYRKSLFNLVKLNRENFAIFDSMVKGPSVQALEIIRHGDAGFDMKKSRWDYQFFYN